MNFTDNYTKVNKKTDSRDSIDIASIPFILFRTYVKHHRVEFINNMEWASHRNIMDELLSIRRELKRPITPIQQYAKTKHAAAYLDVDPSYLDKKRREGIFIRGKHYFSPSNESIVRWDLLELARWMRDEEQKEADNEFLSNIEF